MKVLSVLLMGVVSLVLLAVHAHGSDLTVMTDCGPVEGVEDCNSDGCIHKYLGVPYAAPPIGSRRFAPPEGLKAAGQCWNGTLHAWLYRNHCVQFGMYDPLVQSEDCLFANVFSPAGRSGDQQGDPLPVMLFIHGGSSIDGMSDEYFGLASIAHRQLAVVVTINYRLNSFGFLALKELSQTDPRGASGNYGILDQRQGLIWIQENIAAFGGDPKRVTVFGQSSGGTHILAYLAAPSFKGLFSAGISLSGSPNITMDLGTAERQNVPFLQCTGCASSGADAGQIAECLRTKLSTEQIHKCRLHIWAASVPNSPPPTKAPVQGGVVIVDGATVVDELFSAVSKALVDVPMIIGTMAQENGMGPAASVKGYSVDQLTQYLDKFWGSDWHGPHFGETVMQVYRTLDDGVHSVDTEFLPQTWYDTIGSDAEETCANLALIQVAKKSFRSPVYSCWTTQGPSHDFFGHDDAFHMWDLVTAGRLYRPVWHPEPADLAMGDNILRNWLDLAANGTIDASRGWKAVQEAPQGAYYTAILNTTTTTHLNLLKDKCDFWLSVGVGKDYWWAN